MICAYAMKPWANKVTMQCVSKRSDNAGRSMQHKCAFATQNLYLNHTEIERVEFIIYNFKRWDYINIVQVYNTK